MDGGEESLLDASELEQVLSEFHENGASSVTARSGPSSLGDRRWQVSSRN